jgi:putative transposase
MATTVTMIVHQAYRFALDPTPRQQGKLASHTGAARLTYNWGLALVKDRLDRRQAGEDVHVPWSLYELRREWNQAKHKVAPWWAAQQQGGVLLRPGWAGTGACELGRRQAWPPQGRHHGIPPVQAQGP